MGTKNLVFGLLLGGMAVLLFQIDFDGSEDARERSGVQSIAPATIQTSRASFVDREITSGKTEKPIPTGNLKQLLRESTEDARYRPATPAELVRFERLLVRTLNVPIDSRRRNIDGDLVAQWRTAGWRLHRCEDDALVISEASQQRMGRGIYAIDGLAESKAVLQAPHRFYDEGSGLIVRKLFQEHSVRAAAWNTVHRREVDLAHADNQYLNAFTRAIMIADRDSTIVQLHGFSSDKYAWDVTTRAVSASVIVSDGSQFPSRETLRRAADFKLSFGADDVLLFPNEVQVLGGTKNQQSRLLRKLGSDHFLHLEMSNAFRKQMLQDQQVRREFFQAL